MDKENLRANAIAAAYKCNYDNISGIAIPNIIYTNVGKLFGLCAIFSVNINRRVNNEMIIK